MTICLSIHEVENRFPDLPRTVGSNLVKILECFKIEADKKNSRLLNRRLQILLPEDLAALAVQMEPMEPRRVMEMQQMGTMPPVIPVIQRVLERVARLTARYDFWLSLLLLNSFSLFLGCSIGRTRNNRRQESERMLEFWFGWPS